MRELFGEPIMQFYVFVGQDKVEVIDEFGQGFLDELTWESDK